VEAVVVKEPLEVLQEVQDQTHGLHGQQQPVRVRIVDTTAEAEEAEENTCPIMLGVPEAAEQVVMEALVEVQELQTPEVVEAEEPGMETCHKVEVVLEGQE